MEQLIQEKIIAISNDWKQVTIPDVIGNDGVFVDGDWIESEDQDPNGDVRLIQLADIGDGIFKNKSSRFLTLKRANELNCTFLKEGDILIARMPDPIGRACIFPLKGESKFVTAVDVAIVRPNKQVVDVKYLLYAINSPKFRRLIEGLQSGTTRKRISRKNLSILEFPLPSKEAQKQIVSKIEELFSELDKGIEELKTAQQQLKVYRQAVLKWAFEGKLTNDTEGWVYKAFKECLKFSQGVQVDVGLQKDQIESGYVRFLRIIDFTQGVDAPRYISNPGEKYFVTKNDIALVRYGASTGFVCTGLEGAIANNLFKISPTDAIGKRYLFYFLTSSLFQNVIAQSIKGAAMPAISFGLINDVKLPIPDFGKQKQIVQEIECRLSVCDKIEETIADSLKQAEALRQSILKEAFRSHL